MAEQYSADDLIDDVAVVIVAAGSGERLGSGRPKAFVGVGDQVMLAHSLAVFEAHEAVDSIVLVVPEDWVGPAEVLVDDLGCERVSSIEVGGASRAASVRNGIDAVPDRRGTAVLVHDAARPLVPADVIDRVLAPLAEGFDAAVPALAVVDTVKEIDSNGVITRTPQRDHMRRAQTPQACRASALHAALRDLDDATLATITDCSAAIERNGGRGICVAGDERLTKITTIEDLRWIEQQLGVVPAGALEDDTEDEPLDDEDLVGSGSES